jgi:hypothetical protein
MVDYRELNLNKLLASVPETGFDLYPQCDDLFRLVETKKEILGRIARLLRPTDIFLGGAETTFNLDDSFRRCENLKASFISSVRD